MLDGKTIIITGAGGGQGEATARLFAESGASVILTDIDEARVKDVAASLGSSATGCQHDISDEAGWQDVVEAAGKAFGDIDGLINNAGILATGALEETSAADMERLFQINVLGAFLGMKAVSPNMPEGSSIVNIASAAGLSGKANMLAYSTSKWALRGLSRSAALDLAPRKIRVNTICPGVIDTPMIRNDSLPGFFDQVKSNTPLVRAGEPMDIAKGSLYLVSDASSYMTGGEIVIDGGRNA